MQSLAYTPPKREEPAGISVPTPANDSKPQFPSVRMNGEQAQSAGLTKCTVGETYEMTVQVKVKRIGIEDWDGASSEVPSVELDVISASPATEVETPEEDAAEGGQEEDAGPMKKQKGIQSPRDAGMMDGYKKKPISPKPKIP